ncbi:MAG: NADP-dependent malic enzyme [Candidatus Omnitrophica bacterium]|nr:NADP-dependent malic enzyme [Candidatus Omnitrophota bacterium]MCM8801890.1 NADP-dependent malic enzyme [Candidatus Omnitrophota bacterium]
MKNLSKEALKLHKKLKGKLEIKTKVPLKTRKNLSLAYTPGVAIPCLKIKENKEKVYDYTWKRNTVAIVTDGSAVLGLGNIGPYAALPVMEGKAILFKEFGGVDAIPICLETQKVEEIIDIIKKISPTFGGINLEDISAPRCFTIEQRLNEDLDIPVFHDDQDGTAIVVLAGLINALKLVNKKIEEVKIVINGAGAAGIAITKMLYRAGARKILLCDREGMIYKGRKENMNFAKEEIIKYLWVESKKGTLKDAMKEADVFIGVSGPNLVTEQMIKSMNKFSIVFAMSNPIPEIMPDRAKKAGAYVVATGRSDFPNQINNLLAFPGIFRGTFDAKAKKITEKMKISASLAIAKYIPETELSPSYIIPSALDKNVAKVVAKAVKKSAISIT